MGKKIKSVVKTKTKKTIKQKQKAISPLIAVILLVVVAVILVGVMLSFGQNFTVKGTEKTREIFKEDESLTGYLFSSNPQPEGFTFKNLSNKTLEITHYEIIGLGSSEVLNTPIPFSSTITASAGSQVPIPIVCSPGKDYVIKLISSDNSFVTVKINNVTNYEEKSCEDPSIPDLVCLGAKDNGSGDTNSNPYVICSLDDFNNIRNNLSKHYKLGRNLDLNVSPYNEGEGWVPIGNSSTKFTGSLDGGRYTISNLYINRPTTDYQGLFGYTNTGAVINNVRLENVNVIGYYYTGGLVGYNYFGTITNSSSSGSVSGTFYVGGLVGYNYGTISGSSSSGSVFGASFNVGGLVGYNSSGTITSSSSSGSVSGTEYVGGLVGSSSGIITNSYALGDVTRLSGTRTTFGGFLGSGGSGTITNCYSTGRVIYLGSTNPTDKGFSSSSISGNNYWDTQTSLQSTSGGGATGKTTTEMKTQSTFTDWDFNTVWAIEEGVSYPYLRNNLQSISPRPTHSVASNYASGTQKYLSLDIILSSGADEIYYTINGIDPNCSGTGTLYTNPITITTGTTTIKATGCKTGYNNKVSTFTYILPEPIMIFNADDLNNIRNNLNGFYALGADINLNISPYNEGEGWEPIGNNSTIFTGSLDGGRYTISNLYINRSTSYQGLFGYTAAGTTLNNVRLENVNIIGKDFVGSLVGSQSYGTITNSSSSGSVSGIYNVGGLVGNNDGGTITESSLSGSVSGTFYVGGLVGQNFGTIISSYSSGLVYGINSVGGLVGVNSGTITNSFSSGLVSANSYVGGFVGRFNYGTLANSYSLGDVIRLSETDTSFGGFLGHRDSGTLTNCYSTGRVIYLGSTNPTDKGFSSSSISGNNYWDTEISLQSTSGGGALGRTTEQMKTQSTFTGWDFDAVWAIEEGESYPYLRNNSQTPIPRPSHGVIPNYVSGAQNYFSLNIILSSEADSIYYTTNGTDPNCSGVGILFSSPITITTGTTTIRATGCKSGFNNRVSTFTYTLREPTIILTADDLDNIRNNLNGFYALGADIDLNISPYNTGQGWVPIGNNSTKFTGSLDGGGYTIRNLYINRPTSDYQGLFGYTTNGAAILNNAKLENINIIGKEYVGGLVGYSQYVTILNSSSSGSVSGTERVGGLVGNSNGTITSSSSSGSVSSTGYNVGGLVGYSNGTITSSFSSGSVSSTNSYVGGLVGYSNGTITSSFSSGLVSGTSYVGGLVGNSFGTITSSFSSGLVSGTSYVGGLVGNNYNGTITNSYSLGNVTRLLGGSQNFGGFIGSTNLGIITNCYSIGKVSYLLPSSSVITGSAKGVSWSPDGVYMSVAHAVTPFITIYKRSGDTFTKLANPANLPASTGYGVSWSPDGVYMSVAHDTTPFITIYKRSGDTFTKLANPANLPANSGLGVSWSPDGTYMSVAHAVTPFITIYKRSGDTFTKLANPANLPASVGYGVSWSPDGVYLSVAHSKSPFITIYKRSGDTFTKLSSPANLPTSTGNSVSWSPDGNYLSVANYNTPFVTIYKRSGDTFTKLSNPANLPTSTGNSVSWSPDGVYMSVTHTVTPFVTIYKRSGDTFTKLADPANLPTSSGNSVSWSPDGNYLSVANYNTPFIIIYKRSEDTFTRLDSIYAPTGVGFSKSDLGANGVNNFWDMNTSEQITSGTGATGLTTTQMKDSSNFTGWDFTDIWTIDAGTTYPYLRSITYDENNPKPQ